MSEARPAKKVTTSEDVDAYLATIPEDQRVALEKLRQTIRKAAPQATEGISYGVPGFNYLGPLVSLAAAKQHCGFYVQSPAVMAANAEDVKGYDTSKGTIRFKANEPLPDALVTKLVKARIAENEARMAARKKK